MGQLGLFSPQFVLILGGVEILVGLFLIAGSLTQEVVIVGMVLVLKFLWFKKEYPILIKYNKAFCILVILVIVVCVSLLLSGAGAFAIDIPL